MEYSQRDVQILIVCSVVSVLVIYYSVTYWIPWLTQWIHNRWERKRVLSALHDEVGDVAISDISAELMNYRHVKPEVNKPTTVRRKPTFALRPDWARANLPKERGQLQSPDRTTVLQSSTGSRDVISSTQPSKAKNSTISDTSSRDSVRPRQDLSTFAHDSAEARLHQAFRHTATATLSGAGNSASAGTTASALHAQRTLREEQDAEFRAAEQRDVEKQQKELAKQKRLRRVEERRQFLATAMPVEPHGSSDDKIVTLQFRFREAASVVRHIPAGRSRITRKFSVTHHTAADLLHFVESLELRPLLSGAYELTLDYPTRVVSNSTEGCKTLDELNITTDSVVWVTFSAD